MDNSQLDKDISSLFGGDFSNLDEAALTHVYILVRKALRTKFVESKPISFKVCQDCNSTFPRLTNTCARCSGNRLEDVSYPIGDSFTKASDIYDNERIRKELGDAVEKIINKNLPTGFLNHAMAQW